MPHGVCRRRLAVALRSSTTEFAEATETRTEWENVATLAKAWRRATNEAVDPAAHRAAGVSLRRSPRRDSLPGLTPEASGIAAANSWRRGPIGGKLAGGRRLARASPPACERNLQPRRFP